MPTIEEKNKAGKGLAFDFPSDWHAVKYDQDADVIASVAKQSVLFSAPNLLM